MSYKKFQLVLTFWRLILFDIKGFYKNVTPLEYFHEAKIYE